MEQETLSPELGKEAFGDSANADGDDADDDGDVDIRGGRLKAVRDGPREQEGLHGRIGPEVGDHQFDGLGMMRVHGALGVCDADLLCAVAYSTSFRGFKWIWSFGVTVLVGGGFVAHTVGQSETILG